jgi:hypothetical protein
MPIADLPVPHLPVTGQLAMSQSISLSRVEKDVAVITSAKVLRPGYPVETLFFVSRGLRR